MFIRFLNGLESKFGRFGIPGLLRAVAILTGLTYILMVMVPGLESMLSLRMNRVLSGEVWRLVTFLFIPFERNPIFLLFMLLIMIMCGDYLEHAWGTFKLTVYYLIGIIGTIVVAAIFGGGTATFLNISVFLAFATLFPEVEFRLFFILPVQVRWLALIVALFLVGLLVILPLPLKAAILVMFGNYLLFFGPAFVGYLKTRQEIAARRDKFERSSVPKEEPMHECAVCHRTEHDDPELEFRVAADGEEYCVEHLPAKAEA